MNTNRWAGGSEKAKKGKGKSLFVKGASTALIMAALMVGCEAPGIGPDFGENGNQQPTPIPCPNPGCDNNLVDGVCPNPDCAINYIPRAQLTAPANVSMTGTVLSWSAVQNAAGFRIYVNGTPSMTVGNETSINIADLRLAIGSHDISGRALAENNSAFLNSELSEETTISIRHMTPLRIPLRTPSNLTITGKTLSWDAVDNAHGFRIYIPGRQTPYTVDGNVTSLNLEKFGLGVGSHNISVRALANPEIANQMNSGAADITFTIDPQVEPTRLATPMAPTITGTTLSWKTVPNAVGFRIYINGNPGPMLGDETSINIADLRLPVGSHGLSIRALAEGNDFIDSDLSEETNVSLTHATPIRIPLATPSNLVITDKTLSWEDVPNAIGFRVYLPGGRPPVVVTNGTSLDLSALGLPPGNNKLQVRALADPTIANQMNSGTSGINFYVEPPITQLPAPTNPTVQGTMLSWDAVQNAYGFSIYVNGVEMRTVAGNVTSTNIATLGLPVGNHNIQLRALPQTGTAFSRSELSEQVTVSIQQQVGMRIPLQTPAAPVITGTNMTWGAVTDAIGFRIYVDGVERYTTGDVTSFNFANLVPPLAVGSHSISLRALADPNNNRQMDSSQSETATVTIDPPTVTLPAPTNPQISGSVITWDAVTNAHGFAIYVGNTRVGTTTGNSFNLSTLTPPLGVGNHQISLRTLSDPDNAFQLDSTDRSDAVPFEVGPPRCNDCNTLLDQDGNCPNFANCSSHILPTHPGCDFNFIGGDGRSCIAQFKNLFGNGIVLGDRLPSNYANWGAWVEARITDAIRNAELEVIAELGYDVNWFQGQFPVILTHASLGDGRGKTQMDFAPGAQRHPMVAVNVIPDIDQISFSELQYRMIGSAMIIHEEFISRGRRMHEMPDCGYGFPCLSLESIERVIEFHRIAMRNMHDVGYYYVEGENLGKHNVFSHFENFVTSSRFNNNTSDLSNASRRARGLRFNPDGFPDGYNLPTSENRPDQPWVWTPSVGRSSRFTMGMGGLLDAQGNIIRQSDIDME
ncbi:MAG: hypothetical protein FWB78_06380 [Treponema sp.]|nr:hypothetical protein [Treponema sp.]